MGNENGGMRKSSKAFTHSLRGFRYYFKMLLLIQIALQCKTLCLVCEICKSISIITMTMTMNSFY